MKKDTILIAIGLHHVKFVMSELCEKIKDDRSQGLNNVLLLIKFCQKIRKTHPFSKKDVAQLSKEFNSLNLKETNDTLELKRIFNETITYYDNYFTEDGTTRKR